MLQDIIKQIGKRLEQKNPNDLHEIMGAVEGIDRLSMGDKRALVDQICRQMGINMPQFDDKALEEATSFVKNNFDITKNVTPAKTGG